VAAANWKAGVELLKSASPNGHEMLKANGHAPTAGDLMHMPSLAQTLRQIAEHGKKGFYEGYVAEAIVNVIKSLDGPMDLSDLSAHTTDVVQPIKYECIRKRYVGRRTYIGEQQDGITWMG
ncbi:hypothetical protein SARC_15898, partial [Sphaeroforma arctica JP610]